ncbi:hypothetical protein G5714_008682 [Onychostoma macrolepis]|uniref:Uncharacterized protein n=1 Tax=Onychostoma macrolepis TaxID=369639 RepID=A0A7J6CX54_9TELE|nr:hypothetical protein G5714_008682 [Onychostoma macrolepis]
MYNPVRDTWTVFTPLPIPHVGAASAALEERLYIVGGYCQEDYSEARLTHRYDPVTQRWESMGKMPDKANKIKNNSRYAIGVHQKYGSHCRVDG